MLYSYEIGNRNTKPPLSRHFERILYAVINYCEQLVQQINIIPLIKYKIVCHFTNISPSLANDILLSNSLRKFFRATRRDIEVSGFLCLVYST